MAKATRRVLLSLIVPLLPSFAFGGEPIASFVRSLDGQGWRIATDPNNEGREAKWFDAPRAEAKATRVPWIIQDAYPAYHGVAWYWRTFGAPPNPRAGGRYLLRFWAVDYLAEVWLNGRRVGAHEGGETPFVLDVTDAIKPGEGNRLAVRVLNPKHEPIDGIALNATPHRNKALPYRTGSAWDQGGIVDSVELCVKPPVYVADLWARPDWRTGLVHVQATLHNFLSAALGVQVEFTVAPAASGETVAVERTTRPLPSGDTLVEAQLRVPSYRLWELNDPVLYRVTARVSTEEPSSLDEHSVRCGFRDFRFQDGAFRFNGRRLLLRCSHTGNACPIGLELPYDPDLLRRDLLNVKVMGFNAVRFIAGIAKRYQLDLCDEIGLMVYEEPYAAWCLGNSPQMAQRYDASLLGMVRRDRNHPSVVLWGLLNETSDGPVFRHAAATLPRLRDEDDTRVVMLNSGRWDLRSTGRGGLAGLQTWRGDSGDDPNVTHNPTTRPITGLGINWAPGQLALHPGPHGEYSVVGWTCPVSGPHQIAATFTGIAERATTDVHVLHNGQPLHDGLINLRGSGNSSSFARKLPLTAGDRLDFVVGFGNGHYGGDTTALAVTIQAPGGKVHVTAADFALTTNPNGPWSYGWLAPGAQPDAATFKPYSVARRPEILPQSAEQTFGSLSNPGSRQWQDLLDDQHRYPRVPHGAGDLRDLRLHTGPHPLFLSEYGIGSAVDLWRATRHYERLGATHAEDAEFYRDKLEKFLGDWDRWRMADIFGRPEDFFAASLSRMASQRLLGLNAIRANPGIVAHSLTGTVDQGMTGEGLFTTFRELKRGTVDAIFEGLAPLRLCLFAEPVNVYRCARVRCEAVLANENALAVGKYPVRLLVVGPQNQCVFEKTVNVTIAKDIPFAVPVFAEDVVVDGPPGQYRFLASLERGGAATGGQTEFYVADPAEMPVVKAEVVLAGDDAELVNWLAKHDVRCRKLADAQPSPHAVILVSRAPPAWEVLWQRVRNGATAVFLLPEALKKGDQRLGFLPLANKGTTVSIRGWLYLKDEWAKRHPIFDGLPAGRLMDYTFYREIIPDLVLSGQDPPAEAVAGAIKASQDYSSGLMLAVYEFGTGRIILNTLLIRENLGTHPAADRLLLNLLRYAASEAATVKKTL